MSGKTHMKSEQLIEKVREIATSHPENLMARHFNEDYFLSLDDILQQRLTRIIASGIENPDSQMGAYAMHPDDYDLFAPMLDPMIRDFHGIPANEPIRQEHDWDTGAIICDLANIDEKLSNISMRVRVARNVSTFPLPGAMNRDQRVALEEMASKAFVRLIANPEFGGKYLSITPGSHHEIDTEEYQRRVNAHQMFKDMSGDRFLNVAGISGDWPHGRGMYVFTGGRFSRMGWGGRSFAHYVNATWWKSECIV